MLDANAVLRILADVPLLRIEESVSQPVDEVEVSGDLRHRHLVQGRDVQEQVDALVRQHLCLVRQQKDQIGSVVLVRDLPEVVEAAKAKYSPVRQDLGQI